MKIVKLLSNLKHDGVALERGMLAAVVHVASDVAYAREYAGDTFKTLLIEAKSLESLIERGVAQIIDEVEPPLNEQQLPTPVQPAAVSEQPVSAKVESPESPADEPAATDEQATTPTADQAPTADAVVDPTQTAEVQAEESVAAVEPGADATPSTVAKKPKK